MKGFSEELSYVKGELESSLKKLEELRTLESAYEAAIRKACLLMGHDFVGKVAYTIDVNADFSGIQVSLTPEGDSRAAFNTRVAEVFAEGVTLNSDLGIVAQIIHGNVPDWTSVIIAQVPYRNNLKKSFRNWWG